MSLRYSSFAAVADAIIRSGAYQATKYVSATQVVRATRRHKPRARDTRTELLFTFGQPNYREREFIRSCKRAGEPLPVRKVQLRFRDWPKRA